MVLSQQDYDIAKQRIVNRFLKVNILNFDYKVVDEINGYNVYVTNDVVF